MHDLPPRVSIRRIALRWTVTAAVGCGIWAAVDGHVAARAITGVAVVIAMVGLDVVSRRFARHAQVIEKASTAVVFAIAMSVFSDVSGARSALVGVGFFALSVGFEATRGADAPKVDQARRDALRRPAAWPAGWVGFERPWPDLGPENTESLAVSLDAELRREVAPGHVLHGRRCVAIAKRESDDGVLFSNGPNELAVVHLTWRNAPEASPWPSTTLYGSFAAFLATAAG